MKKILTVVFLVAMAFSMSACSDGDDGDNGVNGLTGPTGCDVDQVRDKETGLCVANDDYEAKKGDKGDKGDPGLSASEEVEAKRIAVLVAQCKVKNAILDLVTEECGCTTGNEWDSDDQLICIAKVS